MKSLKLYIVQVKVILSIVLAFALFGLLLYINNGIGISSSRFETDIRKAQKIEDSWTVDGSFNNNMAAFISYPSDMSDHTFSCYVNRSGLSFGYFFRGGGSLPNIAESIAEIGDLPKQLPVCQSKFHTKSEAPPHLEFSLANKKIKIL